MKKLGILDGSILIKRNKLLDIFKKEFSCPLCGKVENLKFTFED